MMAASPPPTDPAQVAHTGLTPRDATSLQTAWLRSFLAVADHGGFAAAAVAIHISQSRVSSHVADLEHALGVALFDRKARPTSLTEAGEAFGSRARAALAELQQGIDEARDSASNYTGRLVVGSYTSVSSAFLPSVLEILRSEYPHVSVELHEGTAYTLEEALFTGNVDVTFRPALPRLQEEGVCGDILWRERIVAVVRSDDEFASRAAVGIEDLLARPLIGSPAAAEAREGGFALQQALGDAFPQANVVYLSDQPSTLLALVAAGFGVGVINELALFTARQDELCVLPVLSESAYRDVGVFWMRRRAGYAPVRAFLRAVARAPVPSAAAGVLRAPSG